MLQLKCQCVIIQRFEFWSRKLRNKSYNKSTFSANSSYVNDMNCILKWFNKSAYCVSSVSFERLVISSVCIILTSLYCPLLFCIHDDTMSFKQWKHTLKLKYLRTNISFFKIYTKINLITSRSDETQTNLPNTFKKSCTRTRAGFFRYLMFLWLDLRYCNLINVACSLDMLQSRCSYIMGFLFSMFQVKRKMNHSQRQSKLFIIYCEVLYSGTQNVNNRGIGYNLSWCTGVGLGFVFYDKLLGRYTRCSRCVFSIPLLCCSEIDEASL